MAGFVHFAALAYAGTMYLVVFRNRKRADIDMAAYLEAAKSMEALAVRQPGYLSFKSFTADDGEMVAISEWADEASARAWGRDAEHAAIQARGKVEWYAEYTLHAATIERTHRFAT